MSPAPLIFLGAFMAIGAWLPIYLDRDIRRDVAQPPALVRVRLRRLSFWSALGWLVFAGWIAYLLMAPG